MAFFAHVLALRFIRKQLNKQKQNIVTYKYIPILTRSKLGRTIVLSQFSLSIHPDCDYPRQLLAGAVVMTKYWPKQWPDKPVSMLSSPKG